MCPTPPRAQLTRGAPEAPPRDALLVQGATLADELLVDAEALEGNAAAAHKPAAPAKTTPFSGGLPAQLDPELPDGDPIATHCAALRRSAPGLFASSTVLNGDEEPENAGRR